MALACDFLLLQPRPGSPIPMPGWVSCLGGTQSKTVPHHRCRSPKELSLTGNYLSAEQAAAWGLVNRVVAPEELLPTCRALAKDMLSGVPETVRAMKRVIDAGHMVSCTEGLQLEAAKPLRRMQSRSRRRLQRHSLLPGEHPAARTHTGTVGRLSRFVWQEATKMDCPGWLKSWCSCWCLGYLDLLHLSEDEPRSGDSQ